MAVAFASDVSRGHAATVLLVLLVLAAHQYGGAVYRFATNRGQLVVEIENPEEFEVTVRGEEVKIVVLSLDYSRTRAWAFSGRGYYGLPGPKWETPPPDG